MFRKNKKSLKKGIPKYSDLKEIVTQMTVEETNLDAITSTFKFALPEIGRQISKSNGYHMPTLIKSSGIASSILQKIQDVTPSYTELRQFIADELGFAEQQWQLNGSRCYQRVDLEDLYNNHDLKIDLHVVITRKPISKEDALTKYGIK
tara:strand:- start:49 stop:495 length:447 start_codon:yes stop_codon:yes gene_type:complete